MSSCARCIFKPFCQSPGPVCSSFKDRDRYADRNEVIREFAERLKTELTTGAGIMRISVLDIIDDLVKETTEEISTK